MVEFSWDDIVNGDGEIRPTAIPLVFKTPSLKDVQEAIPTPTIDRESARKEARAKAHAKADQDLGLSPPVFIENLKDKLKKKSSSNDDDESVTLRTRSFSERQLQLEEKPTLLPETVLKDPKTAAGSSAVTHKPPMKSVPQTLNISPVHNQPPASPKTEVLRSLFLSHNALTDGASRPSSLTPTSPPRSPRSVSSSNSASYLWAGLSPDESEPKASDSSASPVREVSFYNTLLTAYFRTE